ncbi:hypothetical protein Tco_0965029, partial [Tanacetum coccineum]
MLTTSCKGINTPFHAMGKGIIHKEKLQHDCDLKATNIVLQGLPPDAYSLINHHKVAKDIWDRVKLLMQGTSLSKQECKLARDLHTLNYDQLYEYLEQHEAHANEACLMRERFPDPLALVANYHQPQSHFNNYHSQYTTSQYPQQFSPPNQHLCFPHVTALNQQSTHIFLPIQGEGTWDGTVYSAKKKKDANMVFSKRYYLYKSTAEGKELDVDILALLADSGNAYDSDCDDISSAKAFLMLKDSFKEFDKGLHDEITEVQSIFTQMEAIVEQSSVYKKYCEIQQKHFLIENDRLLDKIISQEIVNIVLNSSVIISQLQAKDIVISKLKETIHSLREKVNPAKVKQDIDEIETINIELEHSVAKLLYENEKLHKEKEHLKQTYKELYDSIKPTRVHAKEPCDALIVNLISKSMENADLKAQIQEKVFVNATLKNELRKLKGKTVIDTVVSKPHATTISLGIFKLDLEPLVPKVLKNKDAHLNYIKHSRENANTLRDIVESAG